MDKFVEKIWFLFLDHKQEGPYSLIELERDERLTPETFAWREGMMDWKKISEIPELHAVFDGEAKKEEETFFNKDDQTPVPDDEIALDLQKGPPVFFYWTLLALFLILLLMYEYIAWR